MSISLDLVGAAHDVLLKLVLVARVDQTRAICTQFGRAMGCQRGAPKWTVVTSGLRAYGRGLRNTMTAQLRAHGLLPVDQYVGCALRIDRRLGTLRPTKKRPPLAFALSRA